jgi:hypothetical protein
VVLTVSHFLIAVGIVQTACAAPDKSALPASGSSLSLNARPKREQAQRGQRRRSTRPARTEMELPRADRLLALGSLAGEAAAACAALPRHPSASRALGESRGRYLWLLVGPTGLFDRKLVVRGE